MSTKLPITSVILRQYNIDIPVNKHNNWYTEYTAEPTLLDTGSSASLMSYRAAMESNLRLQTINKILLRSAVSKDTTETNQMVRANIVLQDKNGKTVELVDKRFLILPGLKYSVLVGMDILNLLKLTLGNTPTVSINEVTVDGNIVEINNIESLILEGPVIESAEDSILNPYERKWIRIRLTDRNGQKLKRRNDIYYEISPKLASEGIEYLPKIARSNPGAFLVNVSDNSYHIPGKTIIGHVRQQFHGENHYPYGTINEKEQLAKMDDSIKELNLSITKPIKEVNTLVEAKNLSDKDKLVHEADFLRWKARREQLISEINIAPEINAKVEELDEINRKSLLAVLTKYSDCFARSPNDCGYSKKYAVDLLFKDKNDTNPRYAPPYRVNSSMAEQLDQKIDSMIQDNVIEPACSPYNSPILAVAKKSGELRVVNNYSTRGGVNEKLWIPKVPVISTRLLLCRISAAISRLKQNSPSSNLVFSNIDIKNAYYSLSLVESKRNITSFIVNYRQLRYLKLSQGLSAAPSVFLAFMLKVLGDLKSPNWELLHYMDDLVIVSVEENMGEALDTVFRRITDHYLTISLGKCDFFRSKITFLGFDITDSGVEAPKARYEQLVNYPMPTTHTEAMRCLGVYNYYSRAAPKLSFCLAPLAKAIGLGPKLFKMNEYIEKGIWKLKEYVKMGLFQHHLNYAIKGNNCIFVCSDASLVGFAGCIGNANYDGNVMTDIKIAAYCSGLFDQQLMLESSRVRETCAAANVLEKFDDMLRPWLKFYLCTDHKSMTGIKGNESLGKTITQTRVRRALAILLNYTNMTILWFNNRTALIQVVDSLSRVAELKNYNVDLNKLAENSLKKSVEINLSYPLHNECPEISLEQLLLEQSRDKEGEKILKNLKLSLESPPNYTINENRYELGTNSVIYRITKDFKRLAWIPNFLAADVIQLVHIRTMHAGQKKLNTILRKMPIFLPGKTKLVQDTTQNCIYCQMSTKHSQEELVHPIVPGLTPFSSISADLMSLEGYNHRSVKYLLTFCCKFSLYLDGATLPNQDNDTVAKALILLIHKYQIYGTSQIQTDNGTNMKSKKFDYLFDKLQITQSFISPYNSRGSRVESVHKLLRKILRSLETNNVNLNFHVNLAMSTYNSTPNSALGSKSPFEIVYGTPSRVPLMHFSDRKTFDIEDIDEPTMENHRIKWLEYLKEHHKVSAQLHVDSYVSKIIQEPQKYFEKGDIVIIFTPKIRISKTDSAFATGPYLVHSRHSSSYELVHVITGERVKRNHRFVRKLKLTPKLETAIKEKNVAILSENLLTPLNSELSDTDLESLSKVTFKGDLESDQEDQTPKYNLRSRKKK